MHQRADDAKELRGQRPVAAMRRQWLSKSCRVPRVAAQRITRARAPRSVRSSSLVNQATCSRFRDRQEVVLPTSPGRGERK